MTVSITNITAAASVAGPLNAGRTVTFGATVSQAVTVTGTPALSLNDGGTATYNAAASSATNLVFNYTVLAGQNSPGLQVTGLLLNGSTIAAPASLSVAPATVYGAGSHPYSVTAADLNGDGKLDLAVADISSGVSVLLGDGSGGFGAAANYAAGSAPTSVTAVDLNGDGKLDLAVADYYGLGHDTELIGDGNGGFAATTIYAGGSGAIELAAADLNGDGRPDLLLTNATDLSILLNDGSGGFGAPTSIAAGPTPMFVTTADVNGDGKLDALVADNGGGVSVLLGDGHGGFAAATTYAAGQQPESVTAADLNGDGKLDLVVANYGDNTVSVLLGNGSGGFGTATSYAVGAGARSVAAADMNGDGKLDLVVANYADNTVSVLLGDGSGGFSIAANYGAGPSPISVVARDVNGDGKPDLVVADLFGGVSVLLNTSASSDAFASASAATAVGASTGLVINTTPPTVASPALAVAPGAGATALGITAPADPSYTAGALTITAGTLPTDGSITLADGTTAVTSGQVLTVAQLTGLRFTPMTGQSSTSSTFTYTVANPAGNVAIGTVAVAVNPPVPAGLAVAPASDSGTLGDHLTNVVAPAITGTGVTGDTITLRDGNTVVGSAAVINGSWSIISATLAPGSHNLTATQTDGSSRVSLASSALVLTIDTTIPSAPSGLDLASASDSGVAGDRLTNVTTPTVTGTGVVGDTVTLLDGSIAIGSTVVTASNGGWSIMPTAALAAGLHGLSATQSSAAGNVSPASASLALSIDTTIPVAPSAPVLAADSDSGVIGDQQTDATRPTITGTGVAGDTVTLYDGTIAVGSTVITAGSGSWSITPTAALTDGLHHLTATQSSPAGNVSLASASLALTIDTTTPAPISMLALDAASDSGALGDGLTNITVPTITGTGASGDAVILYDGTTPIGAALIIATDGAWSITPTTALAEGVHSLTATQTSPVGHNSAASAALALSIDTTAPAVPTLAQDVAATDPAKPVISGVAEAGSLVRVYEDGTSVGTASATSTGWAFAFPTALAVGGHVVRATATDDAGNVSAASLPLPVTVNHDHSYAVVRPVDGTNKTEAFRYDSSGSLATVQTSSATGQLLVSVSNSSALIGIYDTSGNLIGTITQPSVSVLSQPVFTTTPGTLAASAASGPAGSLVNLLAESTNFVSQGRDTITTYAGSATITAEGASTTVDNIGAALTFYGRSGTTTVHGGHGSVTAIGGSGGGLLVGGTGGRNVLVAGGGVTTLVGGASGDTLYGSDTGTDTIFAGAGAAAGGETLVAGAGSETLIAGIGSVAFGGAGQSTLFAGRNGGSVLVGGSGTSVLVADGGNESMWGGSGSSTLWAGSGDDVMGGNASINSTTIMRGGTGHDVFIASGGTTTAYGGSGSNVFWGGSGAMSIIGGSGNDTVVFGSGATHMTGGSGSDIYTFINGRAGGMDVISNFKVGVDHIDLFQYGAAAVQQQLSHAGLRLMLSDHTSLLLAGVTQLAGDSLRHG